MQYSSNYCMPTITGTKLVPVFLHTSSLVKHLRFVLAFYAAAFSYVKGRGKVLSKETHLGHPV